jgi:trehalose utilization protein
MKTDYNFSISFNLKNEPHFTYKAISDEYIKQVIKNAVQDALESAPACEYQIVSRIKVDII